jgi:hypothetical protein
VLRADNRTNFMCRLSLNLERQPPGTLRTCPNLLLPRPHTVLCSGIWLSKKLAVRVSFFHFVYSPWLLGKKGGTGGEFAGFYFRRLHKLTAAV